MNTLSIKKQLIRQRFYILFCMIFSLILYFSININDIWSRGSRLDLFFFSMLLGVIYLIISKYLLNIQYKVKNSFIILSLFFFYFFIRICLDLKTLHDLKAFGILVAVFYCLGALVSVALQGFYLDMQKNNFLKRFNIFLLLLSFMILTSLYLIINNFSVHLRSDILLMKNTENLYQRPGDFLSLIFIIYYLLVMGSILQSKKVTFLKCIFFSLIVISSMLGMYLAQIFGSNNSTICIAGLLLVFCVSLFFHYLQQSKLLGSVQNLKTKVSITLTCSLVLGAFAWVILIWLAMKTFSIDQGKLRIFGFSELDGSISMQSSVHSRVELWKNFHTHLYYDSIDFGNVAVDRLTTGEGTYIHSFIASILTHLGLLGLFIFLVYLFFSLREGLSSLNEQNMSLMLFYGLLFGGFFLIANLFTFFTWLPMWFLMGVLFSPLYQLKS